MLFAANVNAQEEVHGVETRMVCTYDCNPNGTWDYWGRDSDRKNPWFAYEFTNRNSIPVSVEVELYHRVKVKSSSYSEDIYDYKIVSTKSFVLESGESYIFKTEEKGINYYDLYGHSHKDYYIKYKAYKLL